MDRSKDKVGYEINFNRHFYRYTPATTAGGDRRRPEASGGRHCTVAPGIDRMTWKRTKLKFVARLGYGDALPADEVQAGPFQVFGSNGPYASFSRSNTGGPAIIVGRKGSFGKVNWTAEPCFASDTTFFIDASTCRHELRWVYWVLQTLRLDEGTDEAAIPGLNRETAYSEDVLVPPAPQQQAIADYLDRETARLDALVAAKERVLGLLAEKRRAIITRAVTRGLDPHAPVRDSGLPWLGEMPAHWRTLRLRFLVHRIEQGWSPEAENREPSLGEWGVLKLNAVNRGRFDEAAVKALPADVQPRDDLEVHEGDFLVTRSNTPSLVGDACFVETTRPRLMLCDLIYRLALRTELIDGRFLGSFSTLPLGRGQIETDARGTSGSMVKISQEHIKDWLIPVPPLTEQHAVVARLAVETTALNRVQVATERTIALLKERRAALIAAAVTGRMDLRTGGGVGVECVVAGVGE